MASDIIALDAAVEAQPEIPAPVLITAEPTGSVVEESVSVEPEAALEPKDEFVWRPQAPIFTPGEAELAAPAPAPDPQEDAVKRKAVELLKEALQKAAAAPLVPHPKVEVLKTLCLCICKLAKEGNTIFGELTQILPKLGVSHLAPLLGSASRPRGGLGAAAADAKAAPPARQRLLGRAKSYNTRKGFGFIELPGFCRDIFVFNSHLIGRVGLIAGEPVEFELVLDDGRPQARNVKVLPKDTPILKDAGAQAQGANEAVKQALLLGGGVSGEANEGGGPQALAGTEAAPQGPDANKQKMGGFQARSQEDILFEKIREAQSAAMKEKRKAKAKASAPPPEGFPEWRGEADPLVLLAATGDTQGLPPRSFVEPRHPEASREEEVDKFLDEGNIPKNSKIRVINFPATDVNGSIGVVKGFNARSKKYSIVAELRTGQGDSAMTETVSLQLKEEYMKVLELPPGKTARNLVGGPSTASQTSKQDDELPPLTGAPQTEALRTAASEALRKFHQFAPSAARQPAPGPNPFMGLAAHAHPAAAAAAQGVALGHMGLGGIYPGQAGAAAVAAAAAGAAGAPGVAAAAVGAPPAGGAAGVPVGGLRGPPPGAGMGERGYRKTSPDVRAAGPPSAQTWLAQGSAQAARITSPLRERPQGMQPQGQVSGQPFTASSQWDMTSGGGQNTASTGARPTGGVPLEQYARDRSLAATMPSAGHSAMSGSQPSRPFADGSRPSGVAGGKAPAAAGQLPQPGQAAASEGQVGQVWRVRASKEFVDVIVRATEEVNSPELRHIGHGEVVIQRGPTVTLKNRLVRMPIKPDGWVTVHAKHIGGPEFLEEVVGELNQKARAAAGRATAPGAGAGAGDAGLKQIARAGDGADGGGRRGSPPPPREGAATGARLPSKGAARAEPRSDDPWLKTLKATAADGSDKDGGGQAGREADVDPWAKDIVDPWAKPAARRSALEGSRRTAADTASSWGPSYAGASTEGRSFDRPALLMLRARLLEAGRLELEDKTQRIRVLFLPMQEASKRGYRDRRARNGDEEEDDEEEQQQQSAPQQQQQQQQSQQQQAQQAQQQQQSAASCPTQ